MPSAALESCPSPQGRFHSSNTHGAVGAGPGGEVPAAGPAEQTNPLPAPGSSLPAFFFVLFIFRIPFLFFLFKKQKLVSVSVDS